MNNTACFPVLFPEILSLSEKKDFRSDIIHDDTSVIELAISSHAGQFRNTGEPFHMHPLRMYESYLCSGGTDISTRRALLLHDVAEDTEVTIGYIRSMFGECVAYIVDANTCSDVFGSKLSKYEMIRKFIKFSKKDWRCLIVKLFDCIDNLETIHGLTPEKQQTFQDEKRQKYLPIFIFMIDFVPNNMKALYIEKVEIMRNLLI